MIHNKIKEKVTMFTVDTGKEPVNLYLGRIEMAELIKWAQDNDYIGPDIAHKFEGANRPEVNGLFVYEVNADSHLECV